jgi:hypothetical protein
VALQSSENLGTRQYENSPALSIIDCYMSCCCSKKSVHIVTLDLIYYKTKEFPADFGLEAQAISPATIDDLKHSVKDKTRALIDYLENNQRKLRSVGAYMSEKCRSSNHPVDHLISLFILNNILPVIKNFSYDKGDMVKMIKKAGKGNEGNSASVRALLNRTLAENYLTFEESMIDIFEVLLSQNNLFGKVLSSRPTHFPLRDGDRSHLREFDPSVRGCPIHEGGQATRHSEDLRIGSPQA